MKKGKKIMITVISIVLVIVLGFGIGVGSLYAFGDKIIIGKTEVKEFTTQNEGFKVGIISDTQLPPTEEALKNDDKYVKNLENALTVFKKNDVDMILFAGDIGDLGTYFAFETYNNTINKVYGDDKPIIQTIMGNHDFWNKDASTAINHIKAFEKTMNQSPWTHYVVNGFHFIGASPNCGMMKRDYVLTVRWLEKELDAASKASNGKPIFVTTHNQPKDTCYGSDEWGDSSLNEVLSKYPNVVLFGGHSHYSVLDERTIWQGDYTVIQTQSLSYTELKQARKTEQFHLMLTKIQWDTLWNLPMMKFKFTVSALPTQSERSIRQICFGACRYLTKITVNTALKAEKQRIKLLLLPIQQAQQP